MTFFRPSAAQLVVRPMDQTPIDFWDAFHDGTISAAEQCAGFVRMFVNIGYLRRRIQPIGSDFVITLTDVTTCEFHHFDGEVTTLPEALDVGKPDILSTEAAVLPTTIHTSLGQLVVTYGTASFALDAGGPITFSAIAEVATAYWNEFKKRSAAAQTQ